MRLIDPPGGKPWALLGIASGSILLNIVLAAILATGGDADCPEPAAEVPEEVAPLDGVAGTDAEPEAQPAAPTVIIPEGMSVLSASIVNNMAYTLQAAEPERGDVINAVAARLLWWDLDLRSDLQKGDQVRLAYEWDGELAHVAAVTYESHKLGRTLTAYRYKASGDVWQSWWSAEGVEVQPRINSKLISDYEQITAVVNSRHRHNGIDLKAPEGEDVYTPKGGSVVRTNWNHKYNGNGVEIRYDDGTLARFLHLSETAVDDGARVAAGARIGASGNTGRSTAPHLHYELEKNGKTLDPFAYHGTSHRTLPEAERAAFEAEVQRLEAILDAAEDS